MPSRYTEPFSVLYALPWIGVGTLRSESLCSYFYRLAFVHSVTPSILYREYVSPRLKNLGFGSHVCYQVQEGIALSSDSVALKCLADTLIELTGIREIKAASLQGLAALVSHYGLGSKRRRYCPECFAAQESGLYGHALWDFRVVNACPIHGVRLIQDLCGDPGAGLRPTRKVLLAGICRRCGSIGMHCNSALPSAAEPSEIWVAQQVGDLVAYASAGGALSREALQKGMISCSDGFRSKAALVRSIGISSNALRAATLDARQKPALEVLLSIASRCGVSLLSIFLGQPAFAAAPAQTYVPPTPVRPTWKLDRAGLDKKIDRLTASYRTITSCSDSGASVSKALGVNRRYLAYNHPKLWAAIVAAHENYRVVAVEASYATTREIVAMAIDKAIESHVPLTEQSVTRLIRMEGQIRMGAVSERFRLRKVLREALLCLKT